MYRAIYLVACAATGRLARAIAEEGGIDSVRWAGDPSWAPPSRTKLSVRVNNFEYNLVFGLAGDVIRPPIFANDPEIKAEDVFFFKDGHKKQLLKRRRSFIEARDSTGKKIDYTLKVPDNESILTGLRDPLKFPELFALRQEFFDWRFYHHFRTDPDSPLRKQQISVMTPIMSHDGRDFAAALATILDSDLAEYFQEALNDAFPDSRLLIDFGKRRTLRLSMSLPGVHKPLDASELSDGTLQYLCLLAALISTRPASMLALNEPETSIHPNLYEPLARLIVAASKQSQIWITTHSRELSDLILEYSGYEPLELEKVKGETRLVGVGLGGYKDPEDEEEDDEEGTELGASGSEEDD